MRHAILYLPAFVRAVTTTWEALYLLKNSFILQVLP